MPRRQQKFWQRNDGLLVNKEREKKEYKRKGNRGEHRSTLSVLSVLAGAQILKVKMYLQVRCIINNQRVTDFLVWIRNDLLPSKQMWEASPAERTLVCRERWCSLVAVHHAWRRARSPALGSGSHAGRNTQVVLPGCGCWHSRGPAPFFVSEVFNFRLCKPGKCTTSCFARTFQWLLWYLSVHQALPKCFPGAANLVYTWVHSNSISRFLDRQSWAHLT